MLSSVLDETLKEKWEKISMAREVPGAKELETHAIEMPSICIAFYSLPSVIIYAMSFNPF